jgi:hypothetical protein
MDKVHKPSDSKFIIILNHTLLLTQTLMDMG